MWWSQLAPFSSRGAKALTTQTPWAWLGRPWQQATPWSARRLCQWTWQERREGVMSNIAKLIQRQWLLLQVHQLWWRKQDKCNHKARWPSEQETPGRLGKFMPLISYGTSIGINKNGKNKLQKQVQAPWHVERPPRAWHSQYEQRGQVNWQRR